MASTPKKPPGKPPAIFVPMGRGDALGGGRVNLRIPNGPHNIPSERGRPERLGYSGTTPVEFIQQPLKRGARRPTGARPGVNEIFDPHHYATVIEQLNVPIPTTAGGALILTEPDFYRNMLGFRNTSATANIYVSFGGAASANSILRIIPNTMILYDGVVPQNDIYAFADAAAGFLSFHYSNIG